MMRFFLLACLASISISIVAQETALELNPVTVTATLQPSQASRTGRNIVSIKGNHFDKLPVHSLDDLLRYIPGIEVQMRGPAGSQSDIVLRGGTFQQVLVLLDGIRLNDPNTGHFNGYIPISPSEIERIEVLKGASSAIYGSEAVGGVINIITKSFAARKNKQILAVKASATGGEYELLNVQAGMFYQRGNTAIGAGVLSNNSEGQLQRGTRGFFHNHTASVSFRQFIGSNWSIALRSSLDQRRFGAQNFYTSFVSDTANEKVTTNWNQASFGFEKGRHRVSLDMGYKFVRDIYRFNPKATSNNNRSNLLQVLAVDHFKMTDATTISSGIQYQNRNISSNDRGVHHLNQLAGFVILQQQFHAFTISPSARIDYSEGRGTEFIPQVNLSWQQQKFQIRGSLGKTIRDADFTERYNNYNKTLVTGGSIGNPNLEAERSFSYEAGADYFFNSRVKISVTGFQRHQSNLVDWVTTPYSEMPRKDNLSPTGTYALARNIAKVRTKGVEADVQVNGKNYFTTLGLIWMESKSSSSIPSFLYFLACPVYG